MTNGVLLRDAVLLNPSAFGILVVRRSARLALSPIVHLLFCVELNMRVQCAGSALIQDRAVQIVLMLLHEPVAQLHSTPFLGHPPIPVDGTAGLLSLAGSLLSALYERERPSAVDHNTRVR